MSQTRSIFFSASSYHAWGTDAQISENMLDALVTTGFTPDRFDDKDPPRRQFAGGQREIEFWLAKPEKEWSRWLFLRRTKRPNSYSITIRWMDLAQEPLRSRGDYHQMYGTVSSSEASLVVDLWKRLCAVLRPFHAFLDEVCRYRSRANIVLPDGTVEKPMGGYLAQLPGLFAYNYFGPVYMKLWRADTLSKIRTVECANDMGGCFLHSPTGLDAADPPVEGTYSPEETEIIQLIGSEYFFLPDRKGATTKAPTIDEFKESM